MGLGSNHRQTGKNTKDTLFTTKRTTMVNITKSTLPIKATGSMGNKMASELSLKPKTQHPNMASGTKAREKYGLTQLLSL